jgi:hypothetical protein
LQAEAIKRWRALAGGRGTLFALLALVVAASRWPFLGAGYGSDPDSYRLVEAALVLRDTGTYKASRFPGHPVQEYVVASLVHGGEWVINGMTCVMSCICAVTFAAWLRELGVKSYLALAAGFAFVPVIYVNSTCAMDYVWALAFVLSATLLTTLGRPLAAGVCAGLAIGTRITSGAMLLPLAMLVVSTSPSLRQTGKTVARLWLAALVVGALCYVPVFARYGRELLDYTTNVPRGSEDVVLRRATLEVWGPVGCAALAFGLIAGAVTGKRAKERLPARRLYWVSAACVTAVVLYTIAYFKLPDEAGYLVPVVPFAIALGALWMTSVPSYVFALFLFLSPFVDYAHGSVRWAGELTADHRQREAAAKRIRDIIRRADRLPAKSVLIAAYHFPLIRVTLSGKLPENPRYMYLIENEAQYDELDRDGYSVYFVDRAIESYQQRVNGIRLRARGAHVLPPVRR